MELGRDIGVPEAGKWKSIAPEWSTSVPSGLGPLYLANPLKWKGLQISSIRRTVKFLSTGVPMTENGAGRALELPATGSIVHPWPGVSSSP
jgi:hypothetical protein